MRRRCALVARHHPLFVAALPVVAVVLLADRWPAAAVLWPLTLAAACAWFGCWRRGLAVALMAAIAAGSLLWHNHRRAEAGLRLAAAGEVMVSGRATADASGDGVGFWQTTVRLSDGPCPGALVLWQGLGETPVAGAVVRAAGRFRPLDPPLNPGEFDSAAYHRRHGVTAQFFAARTPNSVTTGWLARLGAAIRHGFRDAVTAGLVADSQAAMTIRAVVIGQYPQDGDSLVEAFRNSGTLHLFSVSGMHVGMVATIGWLLLKWLGVSRRAAVALLLAAVFSYAWITGNNPPSVRAAWMTAVVLGAFLTRRRPDLLNSLGLVLLATTLWNGNQLFKPGVQLSYGVVAAIAVLTPLTRPWFGWLARPEPYLPARLRGRWRQGWLSFRERSRDALGVSTAASIGSAPLIGWHFGLLTPVSVIATPLLALPVFALLFIALLSAAIHPFSGTACRALNHLNAGVAWLCHTGAARLADLPASHFYLRRASDPSLVVYHLRYGAGAAALSHGDGSGTLIDCGDRFGFRTRVAPSLRRLGITPDTVILSHPDGGHLGGAAQVWTTFPIRRVVLPVDRSLSKTYQAWRKGAPAAGIQTLHAATLGPLELGPHATLEILHLPAEQPHTRLADERVIVTRLLWHGWRILFTSDAGVRTEQQMLASGRDLTADILIAGRHPGDLSLTDAFLSRVNPRVIIVSDNEYPPEQRLDPSLLTFWQQIGITVIAQSRSGGVTLRPQPDGSLVIEEFLSGGQSVLHPSRR